MYHIFGHFALDRDNDFAEMPRAFQIGKRVLRGVERKYAVNDGPNFVLRKRRVHSLEHGDGADIDSIGADAAEQNVRRVDLSAEAGQKPITLTVPPVRVASSDFPSVPAPPTSTT